MEGGAGVDASYPLGLMHVLFRRDSLLWLTAGSIGGSPWRATRPGEGTEIAWARTRPQCSRRFGGLGSGVSIAWTAIVKPPRTDLRRPPTPRNADPR